MRQTGDTLWESIRIVANGIDTLTFTGPLHVSETLARRFTADQNAVKDGAAIVYDLAGLPGERVRFSVADGGAQGGYRWRLDSEECGSMAFTDRDQAQGKYALKCELGAYQLWHHGTDAAYRRLRAAASDLLGVRDNWRATVSRVDFAIDFQGLDFSRLHVGTKCGVVTRAWREESFFGPRAICPNPSCAREYVKDSPRCGWCGWLRNARLKIQPDGQWVPASGEPWPKGDHPAGMELNVHTHAMRRHVTGWEFGRGGSLMMRLYNKSIEIRDKSPKKGWFSSVWDEFYLPPPPPVGEGPFAWAEAMNGAIALDCVRVFRRWSGYCPFEQVARTEFQCRREFLKQVRLPDGAKVQTVEEVLQHAATLARYLMGFPARLCKLCGCPGARPRDRFCTACRARGYLAAELVRPRGWLELRDKSQDPNGRPSRWPLHPMWKRIQRNEFRFATALAVEARRVRDAASAGVALSQAVGNASSFASATGVYERMRARLRRNPTAAEVWAETCADMAAQKPPDAFLAELLKKDSKRAPILRDVDDGRATVPFDVDEPTKLEEFTWKVNSTLRRMQQSPARTWELLTEAERMEVMQREELRLTAERVNAEMRREAASEKERESADAADREKRNPPLPF